MVPCRRENNLLQVYVKTGDTVFSWYACAYSEASTCKISLCCSEWLTKSSLTDSDVEQKKRSVRNSSLKTREQY